MGRGTGAALDERAGAQTDQTQRPERGAGEADEVVVVVASV